MIHLDLNLFYEVYNTIDQKLSKTNSLSFIDFSIFFWYLCKKELKSSSIFSPVSLPAIISMLSLFVCIVQISSESSEEIKLIVVVI